MRSTAASRHTGQYAPPLPAEFIAHVAHGRQTPFWYVAPPRTAPTPLTFLSMKCCHGRSLGSVVALIARIGYPGSFGLTAYSSSSPTNAWPNSCTVTDFDGSPQFARPLPSSAMPSWPNRANTMTRPSSPQPGASPLAYASHS